MKPHNKSYKLGTIAVAVAFVLIALRFFITFRFPEIIDILAGMIIFGLLGFAYGAILIRKDLPAFFVVFGGLAVVIFGGEFLFLLFDLIFSIMQLQL